ncbi:hypothetical protein Q7P37_004252 [Cladosporium fusiforme]
MMNEKRPLLRPYDREIPDKILEKGHEKPVYGSHSTPNPPQDHESHATEITGATWMSHIPSSTPMTALSIPGTHDSAAYTYSWPFIATQTMDMTAQLSAGIRYFDLRCGLRDNILEMVHGSAMLNLRLDQVLAEMYAWLAQHPSEALIVQLKRDRKDEASTVHFAQAVTHAISRTPEFWRTANTTPALGELRGRIQLFRRFDCGPSQPFFAYGLDVTRWQDNPSRPFTIHTAHDVQITIQDHYSFPDALGLPSLIARKGGDVAELLDLACTSAEQPRPGEANRWFINFTSAFEFNLYYQITPREIAAGAYWAFRWEDGMNVRLRGYLAAHADAPRVLPGRGGGGRKTTRRRYGIIAMDFPEAGAKDLVMAVVMANFEQRGAKRWPFWGMVVLLAMLALFLVLMVSVLCSWDQHTEAWCVPILHTCHLRHSLP